MGEANSTLELIQAKRELSNESINSFKSNTDIAGVLKKQLAAVENHDLQLVANSNQVNKVGKMSGDDYKHNTSDAAFLVNQKSKKSSRKSSLNEKSQ